MITQFGFGDVHTWGGRRPYGEDKKDVKDFIADYFGECKEADHMAQEAVDFLKRHDALDDVLKAMLLDFCKDRKATFTKSTIDKITALLRDGHDFIDENY